MSGKIYGYIGFIHHIGLETTEDTETHCPPSSSLLTSTTRKSLMQMFFYPLLYAFSLTVLDKSWNWEFTLKASYVLYIIRQNMWALVCHRLNEQWDSFTAQIRSTHLCFLLISMLDPTVANSSKKMTPLLLKRKIFFIIVYSLGFFFNLWPLTLAEHWGKRGKHTSDWEIQTISSWKCQCCGLQIFSK